MIGLVGPDSPATELAASIDADEVRVGEASVIAADQPSVVVAIGDAAVCSLVRAGVAVPVVPVETSDPLEPVPTDRVGDVLARGRESGFATTERPVIESSIDGQAPSRSLFDAMVVTAEPARISEYTVAGTRWEDRFRADGVVFATPVGSAGYTHALGGPIVASGTASLAVVPVAAFARRSTTRVTDGTDPLTVTVEREEGEVTLLSDGRSMGRVPAGRPVAIEIGGVIETVRDDGEG